MKVTTKKLVLSAMFIAMGLVLPFITGQNPELGKMLSLMHIPVMLCGFICGWPYGLMAGAITPVLRSLLFTQPPMFPRAVGMAFELSVYGAICGLLYKLLPKKNWLFAPELVVSMIAGRTVYAAFMSVVANLGSVEFTFNAWLTKEVPYGFPGIALQLILIPYVMTVLQDAKLIPIEARRQQH